MSEPPFSSESPPSELPPSEPNPYSPPETPTRSLEFEPHHAGTILTLGICSLVGGGLGLLCCQLFSIVGVVLGIVAWAMAKTENQRIDQGLLDPAVRRSVDNGKVCAIVGVVLSGLGVVLMVGILIVYVIMIAVGIASGGF